MSVATVFTVLCKDHHVQRAQSNLGSPKGQTSQPAPKEAPVMMASPFGSNFDLIALQLDCTISLTKVGSHLALFFQPGLYKHPFDLTTVCVENSWQFQRKSEQNATGWH